MWSLWALLWRTEPQHNALNSLEDESNKPLHIIYTRFMQHQGSLQNLARGRLWLFKTICLPSITKQTEKNFLWVILTDPKLQNHLLSDLITTVEDLDNVVVVGANDLYFGESDVIHGRPGLLTHYEAKSNNRMTIQTILDADDGLAVDYVAKVQARSTAFEVPQEFTFWCMGQVVEWHYYAPWDRRLYNKIKDYRIQGAMRTVCYPFGGKAGNCTSSGASVVSKSGTAISKPSSPILRIIDGGGQLPPCTDIMESNPCYSYFDEDSKHPTFTAHNYSQLQPMVFRARSPLSAGMMDLLRKRQRWAYSDYAKSEMAWNFLGSRFGISRQKLAETHTSIADNIKDILEDAIRGQCTPGHSCRPESKELIKRMLKFEQKGRLIVPPKPVWEK